MIKRKVETKPEVKLPPEDEVVYLREKVRLMEREIILLRQNIMLGR